MISATSMFTHQMMNLCIHKPSLCSPSSGGKTHSCHSRHIQTGQWSKEDKEEMSEWVICYKNPGQKTKNKQCKVQAWCVFEFSYNDLACCKTNTL